MTTDQVGESQTADSGMIGRFFLSRYDQHKFTLQGSSPEPPVNPTHAPPSTTAVMLKHRERKYHRGGSAARRGGCVTDEHSAWDNCEHERDASDELTNLS
jgi:hypothetical protein